MQIKAFFNALFFGSLFFLGSQTTALHAQEYVIGGHIGGLGVMKDGASASGIAYGPYMRINPLGWAAFQIDANFAHLDSGFYFSSSPGIYLYALSTDEYSVGMIFGPGFYKLPNESMKFGVHVGVGGDFAVAKNFSIGMETRFHPIFQSADVWSVLVNFGFRFEGSNDW